VAGPAYDQVAGRAALLLGLAAAAIAGLGAWMFFDAGDGVELSWRASSMRAAPLMGSVVAALLFQFAIPVLSVGALFLGLSARGSRTATIGIMAAAAALVIYVLFVYTCYQTVMAS
jgi:p-aminobenzoyl-glutamate transporter AbgT